MQLHITISLYSKTLKIKDLRIDLPLIQEFHEKESLERNKYNNERLHLSKMEKKFSNFWDCRLLLVGC